MKDDIKDLKYERSFDINKVSFENVSREFENRFRHSYSNSLSMMSDSKDHLTNASGASTLGILEKMARDIRSYDKNSDFEDSFEQLIKEYEPFTET